MDDEILDEFKALAKWHAREDERAKRRERILNRERNERAKYMEHVRRMRKLFNEAEQLARADRMR